MSAVFLLPDDLAPFADIPPAKAEAMIDDALALAARVAPCILDSDFAYDKAAKAILRGAILRWHDAGTGALRTAAVDDVNLGFETQQRRSMFWPSEITQLQNLCKESGSGGAFAVDTLGGTTIEQHADICALRFGAEYCSCGAVLTTNLPLYENL